MRGEPREADPRLPHKTSLLLTTAHKKGALARCLDALAKHGVNLTKLESRPSAERPWQYLFYLDHEGGLHEQHVDLALRELRKHAEAVRILGTYPRSGATSRGPKEQEIALVSETVAPSQLKAPTPVPVAKESPSYRLASRAQRAEDTVIEMNGLRIGGNAPFAGIAAPRARRTAGQITARAPGPPPPRCRPLPRRLFH